MKATLLTNLAAGALLIGSAQAAGEGWMTDFEAAKKKAAKENKELLVEFTGSDWCPPCKMLNKNVFSKAEFQKEASKKFVLVGLDFPSKKKLAAELTAQNKMLAQRYGIKGYPTIILCDKNGLPFASAGFQQGGPTEYMATLETKLKNKQKRDNALTAASKLTGKAKADALWSAISTLGVEVSPAFDSVLKDIITADPKNAQVGLIMIKKEFADLPKDGSGNAALFKKLDALAAGSAMAAVEKQELLASMKLETLYSQKNFKGMLTVAKEIIAIDKESRVGKGLTQALPRLEQMIKASEANK